MWQLCGKIANLEMKPILQAAMYLFTQVHLVRRKTHAYVVVYYSKNGEKFRHFTGIKVLSKNITSKGAISTAHPGYEEDLKKIKALR